MEREETAVVAPELTELLPPGDYPLWSPYDDHETAAFLMAALAEEKPGFTEEKNENTPC